jgi:hypothetical protein
VVFNINRLDPVLSRTLLVAFNHANYQLSHSSLLLQLKVHSFARSEVTYRHTLDTKEAVSFYMHLMRKRRGDADEMQQLK